MPKATRAGTVATILLMLGACTGGERPAADPAADDAAPATEYPRIAADPTAQDALPAALLGTAPAPRGAAVHYVTGDNATTGYLAVPEGAGPFPAVIMIHEWNGLVDRVRQVADALAAEGYVALAADLYDGRTGSTPDENMALVRETLADSAGVIANLDSAVRYLRALPFVAGRVAALGWCFGGGVALSWGLGGENHEGTAIFYGGLVNDPARLAALSHEVYGTFARLDDGPSPDDVQSFVGALREAGIANDIHIYDDVDHGFWLWVDEDPATRSAPALDAWRRLREYLARTTG